MSDAALTDLTRSAAATLIEQEERHWGSRMAAYEAVAAKVGKSSSWLREFIGRRVDIDPAALNILSAYSRLCERVEQKHKNELALIAALRADIDAATPGTLGLVERAAGTPAAPTRAEENP